MENKYPALKIVSAIYKVVGYAVIVISVIVAIFNWDQGSKGFGANYAIGMPLILGFFGSIIAFTIAEGIQLFMDIEKNTRKE